MPEQIETVRQNTSKPSLGNHVCAFPFGLTATLLFFVSANDLMPHFYESPYTPSALKKPWMQYDITRLNNTGSIAAFSILMLISTAYIITVQNSMPPRLQQFFSGKKTEPLNWLPSKVEVGFGVMIALYKSLIEMATLSVALPYFAPAFIAGILFAVADFAAQIYNFLPGKKLCSISNRTARTVTTLLYAIGYSTISVVLYFNAINRASYKIGWTDKPLSELANVKHKSIYLTFHACFALVFWIKTFIQYKPRFYEMLSTNADEEVNTSPATPLEIYESYGLLNRISFIGVLTALYKTIATTLSLFQTVDLITDLSNPNTPQIIALMTMTLVQLSTTFLSQCTYYADKTDGQLVTQGETTSTAGLIGDANKAIDTVVSAIKCLTTRCALFLKKPPQTEHSSLLQNGGTINATPESYQQGISNVNNLSYFSIPGQLHMGNSQHSV